MDDKDSDEIVSPHRPETMVDDSEGGDIRFDAFVKTPKSKDKMKRLDNAYHRYKEHRII